MAFPLSVSGILLTQAAFSFVGIFPFDGLAFRSIIEKNQMSSAPLGPQTLGTDLRKELWVSPDSDASYNSLSWMIRTTLKGESTASGGEECTLEDTRLLNHF